MTDDDVQLSKGVTAHSLNNLDEGISMVPWVSPDRRSIGVMMEYPFDDRPTEFTYIRMHEDCSVSFHGGTTGDWEQDRHL
jgi:hypothetical protein